MKRRGDYEMQLAVLGRRRLSQRAAARQPRALDAHGGGKETRHHADVAIGQQQLITRARRDAQQPAPHLPGECIASANPVEMIRVQSSLN